jgi:uncharacterized membrane protein YfcA
VSFPESRNDAGRQRASHAVAGYLAAAAFFVGLIGIVYKPAQVGAGAILVALLAAAMGGPQRRLAAAALVVATASWVLGMTLAVLLDRPIW